MIWSPRRSSYKYTRARKYQNRTISRGENPLQYRLRSRGTTLVRCRSRLTPSLEGGGQVFAEACRMATPGVALARECPSVPECVPVSYPRGPLWHANKGNMIC